MTTITNGEAGSSVRTKLNAALAKTDALSLTAATVMTFPATTASIARIDAAQTFTGVQTFGTPIAVGSVAAMTATVGGGVPTPPNNTTTFLRGDGTFATPSGTGFANPMTTGGDVIYGGSAGVATRLANGTVGQVLTSGGTTVAPTWSTVSGGGLTVGTSTITSGTTTRLLYDNAGVVGESTVTTDGTNLAVVSGSLSFSGNISAATWGGAAVANITGVRHQGVAASFTDTGTTGTIAIAATNIFGVGTVLATNARTFTNYYNAYFADPVASTNVTMTNKWALGADSLKVGTSTQLTVSSVGDLAVLGATDMGGASVSVRGNNVQLWNNGLVGWSSTGASTVSLGSLDLALARLGAANLRQGKAPSGTPIAQKFTLGEASIVGTSSDIGGANGTIQSGLGTGTGTVSSLILQTPTVAAGGTGVQTYGTRLTLSSAGVVVASGMPFWLGNTIVTGLVAATSAGLLTKSIQIQDSAGATITLYGS